MYTCSYLHKELNAKLKGLWNILAWVYHCETQLRLVHACACLKQIPPFEFTGC